MLKFTFLLTKSLLIFLGRVFFILGGLVFSSFVQAALSALNTDTSSGSEETEVSNEATVVHDEISAASAYIQGKISADEYVMFMED